MERDGWGCYSRRVFDARSRRSRRAWPVDLLRGLVLALLLPLASMGSLPAWAAVIGVEGAHVCHCAIDRHDCVCDKCNPEHRELAFSEESLTGRCGDDERAFGGKPFVGISPPGVAVVGASIERIEPLVLPSPRGAPRPPPPKPPPRV